RNSKACWNEAAMSRLEHCPEYADLQQYVNRVLAPEAAEDLARHLEECERCGELVDQLLTGDTLAEALRVQLEPTQSLAGPELRELIHRARAMQPGLASATTLNPARDPRQDLATAVVALLGPPQYAGELGRLGHYRITKVLGSGGMGIVFAAEDLQLQRQVALKTMTPELLGSKSAQQRFLREARAAAAIRHEHVITIHHVGLDRGIPYFAMPLLQGEALHARLGRRGRLPLDQVVEIGAQIAEGLAAAHDRGVIHRDIKPANIWLQTPDDGDPHRLGRSPQVPRIKILDFGLARELTDPSRLTRAGEVLGTPGFIAPEQARAESVDHRCDLFSLGCVLYVMATGKLPFSGKDLAAQLVALAEHTPPAPHEIDSAIPRCLSTLVLHLLAKDPAARPQHAR